MLHIVKPNEIDSVIGKDLGASEWMVIDQERIDKFADATMDHQFIHVDPKQAEPIFGSIIAHGFLSSLGRLMVFLVGAFIVPRGLISVIPHP